MSNFTKLKFIFCMQINIKVDFKILGIKVSDKVILSLLIDMIKHSQSTQCNKFAISLQYLKNKLGMEFIFCMQINIKVFTSWHYHSGWKGPDMFRVPRIRSWQYFCNIKRKKCHNCFFLLLWCKIFRYFTGVQSCFLLLVYAMLTYLPWHYAVIAKQNLNQMMI